MRKIWLQKPNSQDIWDLLPESAYDRENACPFLEIKGMGYRQDVTQTQVNTEYFVSKVLSKNQSITGVLYFQDDEHIKAFQEFVGDFRQQLFLYYSPSAEFEPYDQLSAPYYKKVIISIVDKTEKDITGWYLVPMTLSTQNDVWNRDRYYQATVDQDAMVGNPLVYPYTYSYILGGRNTLAIDFNNEGREVGCQIRIKNRSESDITNIEWYLDRKFVDAYGEEQEEAQRSKWNLSLSPNSTLIVDSNPLTQEARIIYEDGSSQSVVDVQEPSWDYINFVQVQHGQNRLVFYVGNDNVDITFIYREQKEFI